MNLQIYAQVPAAGMAIANARRLSFLQQGSTRLTQQAQEQLKCSDSGELSRVVEPAVEPAVSEPDTEPVGVC